MKYIFNEITFAVALMVLAILFLDPFMYWMPHSVTYLLIAFLLISFAFFAGLVWRARAQDEREEVHAMIAGRIGYLLGAGVLVIGLVWQTMFSHPDPWLVMAFVGMVLGKLAGSYYARRFK